jgi:hypothetical protein
MSEASITKQEWEAKGKSLFGDDIMRWKFKCPVCKHVQCPEDFRIHKEQGATPDSALKECLGRYKKGSYKAFGENKKSTPKQPCDYAAYGLFRLGEVVKMENGKETNIFPFNEEQEATDETEGD